MGWFLSGMLCGAFGMVLLWLAVQRPEVEETVERVTEATLGSEERPKPRFDFYTLLPEQTLDLAESEGPAVTTAPPPPAVPPPADTGQPQPAAQPPVVEQTDRFLLQAGSFRQARDADSRNEPACSRKRSDSFRQARDADSRRGQLILLGLTARVEETTDQGGAADGRWFRVYVGPFDSLTKLADARNLTAQAGIDTLIKQWKPPPQG